MKKLLLYKVGKGLLHPDHAGEYTILKSLLLCCPFCGVTTNCSHTLEITTEDPLTLRESLTCPRCRVTFKIKDGKVEKEET